MDIDLQISRGVDLSAGNASKASLAATFERNPDRTPWRVDVAGEAAHLPVEGLVEDHDRADRSSP
jgi:hypothetical protein